MIARIVYGVLQAGVIIPVLMLTIIGVLTVRRGPDWTHARGRAIAQLSAIGVALLAVLAVLLTAALHCTSAPVVAVVGGLVWLVTGLALVQRLPRAPTLE